MLRVQRDDDGGILASLRLMDRHCERERKLVQFSEIVNDRPAVKVHDDFALRLVDGGDTTDVAVEDVLVVVVPRLQHLVAGPELPAEALDLPLTPVPLPGGASGTWGVQHLLQAPGQRLGAW